MLIRHKTQTHMGPYCCHYQNHIQTFSEFYRHLRDIFLSKFHGLNWEHKTVIHIQHLLVSGKRTWNKRIWQRQMSQVYKHFS